MPRLILALVLVVGLSACSAGEQTHNRPGEIPLTKVRVTRGPISNVVVLSARVTEQEKLVQRASSSGQFQASVKVGAVVTRGQSIGQLDGKSVSAMIDGEVASVTTTGPVVENGALVGLQARVFTITATAPTQMLNRWAGQVPKSARAEVETGPGPFDCPLLGSSVNGESQVTVSCLPPPELKLYPGLPTTLAVQLGSTTDALLLPVSAVAGESQLGRVTMADGSEREVKLGITDGSRIEVVSGLSEGDEVSVLPPRLPAPRRR